MVGLCLLQPSSLGMFWPLLLYAVSKENLGRMHLSNSVLIVQKTQSVKAIPIKRFKILQMNCIWKIPASLPEFQRNPCMISSAAALSVLKSKLFNTNPTAFLGAVFCWNAVVISWDGFSGTSGVLEKTFFLRVFALLLWGCVRCQHLSACHQQMFDREAYKLAFIRALQYGIWEFLCEDGKRRGVCASVHVWQHPLPQNSPPPWQGVFHCRGSSFSSSVLP